MNSPYMGKFRVSQEYKGSTHDGLGLVGVDSKEIHSTVNGTVVHAGWENSSDHSQGFGQYVKIKQTDSDEYYYYGHLSEISVTVNQTVKITDVIGIEGSTGKSTGSHCHYCVRV
ncbi:MAG: M23 family metallopeptidase [Ruminococcus sp.]|nr:M23 family metallopeptidase [Ruminococcus sp.]